jgi:hypothetical protein
MRVPATMMSIFICLCLESVLPTFCCRLAAAQESPATFEEQIAHGQGLLEQGDVEGAVKVWHALFIAGTADQRTMLSRALGIVCYQDKRYNEAWYYLKYHLAHCPENERPEKLELALADISTLFPAQADVTLTADPEDCLVYIDEKQEGSALATPLSWYFEPGEHRFIVEREGMESIEKPFEVEQGGERLRLEVWLKPLPPPEVPPIVTPGGGKLADDGHGGGVGPDLGSGPINGQPLVVANPDPVRPSYWPWVLLGTGAALAGTGGAFMYLALDAGADVETKADEWQLKVNTGEMEHEDALRLRDDEWEDKVMPKEIAAYTLLGFGTAALATGIVWWILEPDGETKPTAAFLAPMPLPGGGAMSFQVGF